MTSAAITLSNHQNSDRANRYLGGLMPHSEEATKRELLKHDAIVFHENVRQVVPSQHKRPLYVTSHIHDVEMRSKMVDPASSLNVIPLSTFEPVGIPRNIIVK